MPQVCAAQLTTEKLCVCTVGCCKIGGLEDFCCQLYMKDFLKGRGLHPDTSQYQLTEVMVIKTKIQNSQNFINPSGKLYCLITAGQ